jgi:Ca-activated chloride channel family protein
MTKRLSRAGGRGVAKAAGLPVLLLIVLAGAAAPQSPPAKPDPDAGAFRISVDVALVVLQATVTGRQGGFVSDLGEHDFEVFEDRIPQTIRLFRNEDVPVTVGLVIDHSTTMLPKIGVVGAAARTFVRSSNPEDQLFVVNFNEKVSLGLPSAVRFTNRAVELNAAIAQPTGGQTALYDAIAKALEELQAGSRDKKALIVVSDGGDNASTLKLSQVMQLAAKSSAVIYTVGIFDEDDPDRNPGVLKRLAQATGGEAFFPGQLGEVVDVCERIARDIRHQYTIGYVPSRPARNGVYRTIRVTARNKDHGGLSVRTRTGYITGGEPKLDRKAGQ